MDWISVEDRLPETFMPVLALNIDPFTSHQRPMVLYYDGDGWHCRGQEGLYLIRRWMSLPSY